LVIKHWACEHPKTKTTYLTYQLRSQKNSRIVMNRHKPCKPYTDHLCITHVLSRTSHHSVWNIFKPNASACRRVTKTASCRWVTRTQAHSPYNIPEKKKSWPELNQYNNSRQPTTGESSTLWHLIQKSINGFSNTLTPHCKNQLAISLPTL
jgi:hypothetical protein